MPDHISRYFCNRSIILRFLFDRALLLPLLRQFYSPEFLEKSEVFEDAACEIVNILSSQIKAHINQHGYTLEIDLPKIGTNEEDLDGAHSIMNVRFSLSDENYFMIDLSSSENDVAMHS